MSMTWSQIAIVALIAIHSGLGAGPRFSNWGPPTNLGCGINSPSGEQGPAISRNGRSLFFGSDRPGGFGGNDLWVSQRASVQDAWGPPVNLGAVVNTAGADNIPALSRDGHWLFFNSDRPGTSGIGDIWASYREHIHDDFGWQPPLNLGAGVNSPAADAGAGYFANEGAGAPMLFFGRGQSLASTDIFVSELQPDGTFSAAVRVPELSSTGGDQRPAVRFDGLELFLFSDRPGTLGLNDLWVSTRETVFDAWGTPANLGPTINTAFGDTQPALAADRSTLYFMSNRPGGCGGFDLYMTTRTRLVGPAESN